MKPELWATYLQAFDAILFIMMFVFTGEWVWFWLGFCVLIFYYGFLSWEFERRECEITTDEFGTKIYWMRG